MGYCLITGGGDGGRYDIELDFGKAQKDAIMAALNTAINKNDLNILQAENELADAAAEEAALSLVIEALIAQYVLITRGEWTGTSEEAFEIITGLPKKQAELAKLKAQNEPLRYKLRQLKFVRASLRKQGQQFNLFQPIQRKQAWCADLTEDRAAGAYVGTIEVKGEPDLVLLQPGARAWIPTDGIVRGREVMSPWQAYWNAAVLPGWQKWKPTYRWGTISSIDYINDTCSVSLAEATSSAQRLGINQDAALSNVPISYMTCNAQAFEEGDRVIVRFSGQDWAAPMVIGFVDNPKPCIPWPVVNMQAKHRFVTVSNGVAARFFWWGIEATGPTCSPQGFGSYTASPLTPSSTPLPTSRQKQRLEIYYDEAVFVGEQPNFTIEVVDQPDPYSVGVQTHISPAGLTLSTVAAQPSIPYPGESAATGYQVVTTAPQAIYLWAAPLASFNLEEHDNTDPDNPCVVIASEVFEKFSGVSFTLPAATWQDLTTSTAYLEALYTKTTVHSGPLHQLLADPVIHVTYHGEQGDVVANYKRSSSVSFVKDEIL